VTGVQPRVKVVDSAAAVPSVSTERAVVRAAPGLPTLGDIQQAVQAVFDGVRRDIEAFGRAVDLAVQRQVTAIRRDIAAVGTVWSEVSDADGWTLTRPTLPDQPDPAPTDTVYGNLTQNLQYWAQQTGNTCVLMSVAMVIGQLTGTMPTRKDIVAEAAATESIYNVGTKIYDPLADQYVLYADGLQLLQNHGITATARYYTNGQGDRALSNVETALGQGQSVIVSIHAYVTWNSVFGRPLPLGFLRANHAVTVLAVDTTNNVVYLNDSALDQSQGQGMELPLDVFMKAWQASQFLTVTAQTAVPTNQNAPLTQEDLALAA
jgi:hypothetical protein